MVVWSSGGPACGDHLLRLDEACLQVHLSPPNHYANGGSAEHEHSIRYAVRAQATECQGCDLFQVWKTDVYANTSITNPVRIPVNTTWPTILQITINDLPSCGLTYHFGLYGVYNVTQSHTYPVSSGRLDSHIANCQLETAQEPENAYLPILWILLLLLALRCIWELCERYLSAYYLQIWYSRLNPWSAMPVVQENLSEEDQLAPHSGEQAQEGSEQEESEARDEIRYEVRVVRQDLSLSFRIRSLDVFRGLSVLLMIFVNYGGGSYWFFKHSPWNGLTLADLVFPWFLWIMGMSLGIGINRKLSSGACRYSLVKKICKRSILLFFIGLCLNTGKGHSNLHDLRIPGVLQRIAFCYLCTALPEAFIMARGILSRDFSHNWWASLKDLRFSIVQWLFLTLTIILYAAITFITPVPKCPTGYLGPGGLHMGGKYENCTGGSARYLDSQLWGDRHLYKHSTARKMYLTAVPFDPEGFLGCITSILLVELGMQAGKIFLSYSRHRKRISRLLLWSLSMGLLGACLCGFSKEDGPIPINKNMWSLSFTAVTSATASMLFLIIYIIVDVRGWASFNALMAAGQECALICL